MGEADVQKLKKLISKFNRESSELLKKIEHGSGKSYKDVPGIEGVFDGVNMVLETGEKYEVPANYAAKSRIVYGDRLKLVEEGGKKLFKQISRVERKRIEGVLSQKDGKWFLLTDTGSYKISDVAADFNKAEINCDAAAFIPGNDASASYAALDEVRVEKARKLEPEAAPKAEPKPRTEPKPKPEPEVKPKPPSAKKVEKKVEQKVEEKKATLEEDDLR